MSNVAGKAYGMNVITPMTPMWTFANRLIFAASRAIPSTPRRADGAIDHPFRPLGHHQARPMVRDRSDERPQDRLHADARQRLHAVLLELQWHVGPIYRRFLGRHTDRTRSVLVFEHKIPALDPDLAVQGLHPRQSDRHSDYYYNATPGAAQRDIKAALRVARAIASLAAAACAGTSGVSRSLRPRLWLASKTISDRRARHLSPATTPRTPITTGRSSSGDHPDAAGRAL